jgi:hypothetical protein
MDPDHCTRTEYVVVACLIAVLVAMLVFGAAIHSPTWDEPGHLVAGISHWQFGDFRMYHVNPPLVRMIAALPVFLVGPNADWRGYYDSPSARPEFELGRDFVDANGPRVFRLFTLARWACVPFSVLGALVTWYWARTLYGALAGIVALALWVFCPNILGFGQLIDPDVGATSLGLLASFLFWRWLRNPGWERVPMLGVAFGLAQLTKFTWVILFGLWPLIWIIWSLHRERQNWWEARQLAVCFLIGIYIINLGYGFSGTFTKLNDYEFVSHALSGTTEPRLPGNRFRGTILEHVPIPLPRNYVAGIDSQKSDFDRGFPSYLRGQWRDDRGWWYYYLYGLAIKVPLGTWLIVLLAAVLTLMPPRQSPGQGGQTPFSQQDILPAGHDVARKRCQTPAYGWRDEIVLLIPALAILVLVSSQTGFSHHLRYVLPCLPFLYIWASKVARPIQMRAKSVTLIAGFGLAWSVVSSLWIYPHSLSYFNELVGGAKGGHWHLGNSNMDWGQDLLLLKRWYDAHPQARPLHLEYDLPLVSPNLAGIDFKPVPTGPKMNRPGTPTTKNWPWGRLPMEPTRSVQISPGPAPGWHAISVNRIHRLEGDYEYFLEFEPVDMIGYSIYVYHITLSEANRVRNRLGLPELTESEAPNNGIRHAHSS